MDQFPKSRDEAVGSSTEWAWDTPEHWPRTVRHVSLDDKGLGLNPRSNEIYWDGVPIVTKNTVRLEGWTFCLAAVATGATVLAAIWPVLLHFGWFATVAP